MRTHLRTRFPDVQLWPQQFLDVLIIPAQHCFGIPRFGRKCGNRAIRWSREGSGVQVSQEPGFLLLCWVGDGGWWDAGVLVLEVEDARCGVDLEGVCDYQVANVLGPVFAFIIYPLMHLFDQ